MGRREQTRRAALINPHARGLVRRRTANGTMVLDIGSRKATWNGVTINLGFAPQIIDGQLFVHGLDLQKNLAPLLFAPPLAFGNRVIVIDPGHGGRTSARTAWWTGVMKRNSRSIGPCGSRRC